MAKLGANVTLNNFVFFYENTCFTGAVTWFNKTLDKIRILYEDGTDDYCHPIKGGRYSWLGAHKNFLSFMPDLIRYFLKTFPLFLKSNLPILTDLSRGCRSDLFDCIFYLIWLDYFVRQPYWMYSLHRVFLSNVNKTDRQKFLRT